VSTTMRGYVVVLFMMAFAPLLLTDRARAQSTVRSQQLSTLQQQNAVLQQRNAVQTALLQTTAMLQGAAQQNSVTNSINFQIQQTALRDALQQTSTLQRSGTVGSAASGQMNILQDALQQSITLQAGPQGPTGVLSPTQFQTLSRIQSSLMGLLLSQPRRVANRSPGP
jgi:hypothetical protein